METSTQPPRSGDAIAPADAPLGPDDQPYGLLEDPADAGATLDARAEAELPVAPEPEPPAGLAEAPAMAPVAAGAALDEGKAPADPAAPAEGTKPAGPRLNRKRRKAKARWDAPAWMISGLMHVGILGGLALVATTSGDVIKKITNLDSSLVKSTAEDEPMTKIDVDPSKVSAEKLTGEPDPENADRNVDFVANATGAGSGAGRPVRSTGRPINERTSLPTVASVAPPSNLQMMSATPVVGLGSRGMLGGSVDNNIGDVGEALDQIAREILRHLSQHRVTVVWMFDESESMRDDQKAIKAKFDRVVNDLKISAPDDSAEGAGKGKKNPGPPLSHAIVGFGDGVHFEQDRPTADIGLIGRAIDRLRIDSTGTENTMSAIINVIGHYEKLITADRKLLLVVATDESGDDGGYVEEARQAALAHKVPVYFIGRQALFGTDHLTINYTDPVTKDVYHVGIRRGPETADLESLQYDGLHRRWDELPSGFPPYELARIAKDTAGIYFTLPTEESTRVHRQGRDRAYTVSALKEYVPDYESRAAYAERRNRSTLRRTLREVIEVTKDFPFRHHYPVIPGEMVPAIADELPVVARRLADLIAIEKRLKGLEKDRDREPEKRWQAAYDLMLAQVVVYQIKAYEYRANLQEMAKKPPDPKQMPSPEMSVAWSLDHSHEPKAPKFETEKVYAEATRLLKLVIDRHPNTPWADLAQDELNRGFSIKRNEWHHKHSRQFEERAKLVPKF